MLITYFLLFFFFQNPSIERLYIFQFPRKFPDLVNVNDVEALTPKYALDGTEIKPEPVEGAPPAPRKKTPPEWGRAGSRAEMASRWPTTEGQMGTLCIHRSGKISLKVNNDLVYDVSISFLISMIYLQYTDLCSTLSLLPSFYFTTRFYLLLNQLSYKKSLFSITILLPHLLNLEKTQLIQNQIEVLRSWDRPSRSLLLYRKLVIF